MKFFLKLYVLLLAFIICNITLANEGDKALFTEIFSHWTHSFNQKNLSASCNLFAKNVTADYQGIPKKNYHSICDGFKKIFSETDRQYKYKFVLHDVYRRDDLAAVRITWYLKVYENEKLISTSQDEGIDILLKNKKNQWEIINYLAYPKNSAIE